MRMGPCRLAVGRERAHLAQLVAHYLAKKARPPPGRACSAVSEPVRLRRAGPRQPLRTNRSRACLLSHRIFARAR